MSKPRLLLFIFYVLLLFPTYTAARDVSLSDAELLSILRTYDAQRIKISDGGVRIHRTALSLPNSNDENNRRFLREYKGAKTMKSIGISTALSPIGLPFFIANSEAGFYVSLYGRYPLYGLGIGLACGGHKRETMSFLSHERVLRDRISFKDRWLKHKSANDTLSQYLNYLEKSLRVVPFATKKGAFSTAFVIDGAPIRLGSYSAKSAKYAAKRIGSDAFEILDRSDRHRRASRATLIGGYATTAVIAFTTAIVAIGSVFSEEDESAEITALLSFGAASLTTTLLSIPLRISSERKFDKGLLQYERDLKRKYYLVD